MDPISSNRDASVYIHYDIPKEGKYYLVLALCDPTTTNLRITGESLVVNPYGHVPASLYGSIPFHIFLLLLYSVLFVVWLLRCMKYSDELMSIHYFIFVIIFVTLHIKGSLIAFLLDTSFILVNFNFLNNYGYVIPVVNFLSCLVDTLTRTIARVLMIVLCLGYLFSLFFTLDWESPNHHLGIKHGKW